MTAPKNFAMFILTHGRPDSVYTYNSLIKCGYTGPIYLLCDDEDKALPQYRLKFGEDKVKVFSKKDYMPGPGKPWDTGDNFTHTRAIVYARNAVYDVAESMGIKYFMQLDDDYKTFWYRIDDKLRYSLEACTGLDGIINAMLKYFISVPQMKSIAMAQGGDLMGGEENTYVQSILLRRKAMNTLLCATDRRILFVGRMNEDCTAYTVYGRKGDIFFTHFMTTIIPVQTQSLAGGMTELYQDQGTYVKTFYTVMYAPSCCKVGLMGETHRRIHHRLSWNNLCPKILSEKWKNTAHPLPVLKRTAVKTSVHPIVHPILVLSKGRPSCITSKTLSKYGIKHYVCVEPQEVEIYRAHLNNIYATVLDIGASDQGIAYVLNWMFNYAKNTLRSSHHWRMDDDIKRFMIRDTESQSNKECDPRDVIWEIEEYVNRHKNIATACPIYTTWAFSASKPMSFNKTCATVILTDHRVNAVQRKGVFEDVDFNAQCVSMTTPDNEPWCTVSFNRLLIDTIPTGKQSGGCTEIEFGGDMRIQKAKQLMAYWPNQFSYSTKNGAFKLIQSAAWRKYTQRPILK